MNISKRKEEYLNPKEEFYTLKLNHQLGKKYYYSKKLKKIVTIKEILSYQKEIPKLKIEVSFKEFHSLFTFVK